MENEHSVSVIVMRSWAEQNGLPEIFDSCYYVHKCSAIAALAIASCDLSDATFAELTIYPPALNGRAAKIRIPKGVIVCTIKVEKPEDMKKVVIGFQGTPDQTHG